MGRELDRNSRNSVYSHFNTNPQPQNNQKNNISKQHRKEARAGEVKGNYKMFANTVFINPGRFIWLLCSGLRYGSVQFLFSTGKMCKFSRTIYNRQLIQFARIPVEFVVRFIVYQNWVKVITSSMTASYLLLISSYS